MNKDEMEECMRFVQERNIALTNMDMEWVRKHISDPNADEKTLLVAAHKARYECLGISPELRQESEQFLKAGGYSRIGNLPWPEDQTNCEHDWNNEGCNPEYCLKCGISFWRYAFMECP